ncbi:MAG: Hsp20/alpha crystallin family protein [Promethearchaeota archaeon]|jgi:HSP20 family protein|nr:MAG: Hsp20/alpha crystallin family protein [Candidatus Lokiarchaeota archaeon]
MPDKDDEIDEEEENEDEENFQGPFDFFKFMQDPAKLFNSKEFKSMFQNIFQNLMKNLPENLKNLDPEELQKEFMKNKSKFGWNGPFMAGFNVNFDSEGKPKINSFGNIKSEAPEGPKVEDAREPLVEVTEEKDKIIVIAEMPGVSKEDIELKATTHSLTISTEEKAPSGRKYFKEVSLPSAINSGYAKARYANGILEVKLKKSDEEHTNIKVE